MLGHGTPFWTLALLGSVQTRLAFRSRMELSRPVVGETRAWRQSFIFTSILPLHLTCQAGSQKCFSRKEPFCSKGKGSL